MSNEYVILADSSCDLPQEMADRLGLEVLPLEVMADGKNYRNWLDGREIGFKEFYKLAREGKDLKTSAVNTAAFEEKMRKILDEGKVTDAQGRAVNFENTVIVMTSNAGSDKKGGSLGFGKSQNDMTKEKVMKALSERQSTREYASKALSLADLSDLLWAANGINRKESGMRTAPSALNKQDVDVYVVLPEGSYLYDAKNHQLTLIVAGDYRGAVAGGQAFVKTAPVSLVLISDLSRFGDAKSPRSQLMGAMDAGIVSQNISIFCSAANLATVPRASMDNEQLKKVLKLKDSQMPMMNHPVGHFK